MRHLLVILMFAVLPARGWAMDVMTVAMAVHQLNATKNIANYSTNTGASSQFDSQILSEMPADCPMRPLSANAGVNDSASTSLFHGCTACQLCMAMATGQVTMTVQRHSTPPTPPSQDVGRSGLWSSMVSLFASSSTLLCCALPALLVALGARAALSTVVSAVPQLV